MINKKLLAISFFFSKYLCLTRLSCLTILGSLVLRTLSSSPRSSARYRCAYTVSRMTNAPWQFQCRWACRPWIRKKMYTIKKKNNNNKIKIDLLIDPKRVIRRLRQRLRFREALVFNITRYHIDNFFVLSLHFLLLLKISYNFKMLLVVYSIICIIANIVFASFNLIAKYPTSSIFLYLSYFSHRVCVIFCCCCCFY